MSTTTKAQLPSTRSKLPSSPPPPQKSGLAPASRPGPSSPKLMALHAAYGNGAVARAFSPRRASPPPVRPESRALSPQPSTGSSSPAAEAGPLQLTPATDRQPEPAHAPAPPRTQSTPPNSTGLPDGLKSGIESLSGISMDNVKVHYNSSQPAQLNALAYAQGSDIHVGPGQERHLPHEAWHLVQQAQGRVKPTMQMKDGVPVNDDEGLEREADVMGAKAFAPPQEPAGQATRSPGGPGSRLAPSPSAPVQLRVNKFEAEVEKYDSPGEDILKSLETANFIETKKEIREKVQDTLNVFEKSVNVPEKVTAVMEHGGQPPTRKGTESQTIGRIGRDEFWLRTGGLLESFEGGHLIPHALWDEDDAEVERADSYDNLVPMSRTMNIMDWADREKKFKEKLKDIPSDDRLKVTIEVKHNAYRLTLDQIATKFALRLNPGVNKSDTVLLYGWLPVDASPKWEHLETGSEKEMSEAEETVLRATAPKIRTVEGFRAALKETALWNRLSTNLKGKILALK